MSLAGKKVIAIVAFDEERAIGKDGGLAWHFPEDLKRFSVLTSGDAVVMGKTTYFSLPEKYRPLPRRLNIVLSQKEKEIPGAEVLPSIGDLEKAIIGNELVLPSNIIWIIGGSAVYESTKEIWDEIEVTKVPGKHLGDKFFPLFESEFDLQKVELGEQVNFERWSRK